jgi:hypothetical protein
MFPCTTRKANLGKMAIMAVLYSSLQAPGFCITTACVLYVLYSMSPSQVKRGKKKTVSNLLKYIVVDRQSKYIHLYIFIVHFLVKENSMFAQLVLVNKESTQGGKRIHLKRNTPKINNMLSVCVS